MFNVRDIVKVLDERYTYDRDAWYFTRNNISYLELGFQRNNLPNKNSKYIIKFVHEASCSCVIQDLKTQQVFIVVNDEKTLKLSNLIEE